MLHSPSTTTSDGPSTSSSTSFGIMPTGDQSDQYDIPWEFKNRALAAVLGQQNFQKSPEQNTKNGNANGGGPNQLQQQQKQSKVGQIRSDKCRISDHNVP